MKSMTGYAYRESAGGDLSVSVELKGYNSRFLDLSVYLPPHLAVLEGGIREYIASRFVRGKIEASVRIKEHNADISVSVNSTAARAYYLAVKEIAADLNIKEDPGLGLLLSLEGVIETEKKRDPGKYRLAIGQVLAIASDQFEAEKLREGKHTEEDILSNISVLDNSLSVITAYVPKIESTLKENLKTRFAEFLGDKIDENRVLAETAVLLVKYTIAEEISRLSSHLKEFRLETERNASPGKKLDFLCQEINREINTIGSKSQMLEVSREVVEMKNALENIREQLRNVE